MANSIGWGEIYKYTWWGNFDYNTQSIPADSAPMGFLIELYDDWRLYFIRVLTDGGTYEIPCEGVNNPYFVAFYTARVVFDGGVYEAKDCLITEYGKLIN